MTPLARRWVETLAAMLLGAAAAAVVVVPQLHQFDNRVQDLQEVVATQAERLDAVTDACRVANVDVPVTCTFTLRGQLVALP